MHHRSFGPKRYERGRPLMTIKIFRSIFVFVNPFVFMIDLFGFLFGIYYFSHGAVTLLPGPD